jgi:hypothetical protein
LHPRELLAAEPDINEVSHEERFSNFDRARVWGEAEERQAGLPCMGLLKSRRNLDGMLLLFERFVD